jgi:C4-dicarboxylate-specific signal transduction histidine kinase
MSVHSLDRNTDPSCLILAKAVERLAAAPDLNAIIAVVRSTARAISGADGVCFVLKDGERCHYVDEDAIAPLWKGMRFPMSACIAGWCMIHDTTAVVTDVYDDPRVPVEAYRPTFIKSMVLVPIRAHAPVGAIGFYWSQAREFSAEELALTEALGRSTSAAFAALKAREEARESERRLAMALEAGGLGAYEFSLDDDHAVATPVCKAVFGRRADAPFGRAEMLAALHPDDRAKAESLLFTGINTDPVYRLDGRERRVEIWGRLVLDENGRPARLTGVARDITDQVSAKERRENVLAELLRLSRLNDLGAMASALAHELNQPLAAGTNYLKAAERLIGKDPDKAVDAITKAAGQFTRTKDIIQRIRGFVGNGSSENTVTDIEQLCRDVLELSHIAARHNGVAIELALAPGLPQVMIDRVQIEQVLLNLLRNAAEALCASEERRITLSATRDGDMVKLAVADTGPGLDPEIAAHLFQPFHTTKDGGMGVGLSLCRKIVEAQGGKLWHEPGDPGASFIFTVPIAAA